LKELSGLPNFADVLTPHFPKSMPHHERYQSPTTTQLKQPIASKVMLSMYTPTKFIQEDGVPLLSLQCIFHQARPSISGSSELHCRTRIFLGNYF